MREPAGRRLMVTGARSWPAELVPRVRHGIRLRLSSISNIEVVMHGGADGVDEWVHEAARALGLETLVFLPALSRPSPQRYHERNDRMLDAANMVLAFPFGESRGTRSVIRKARARGMNLWVVPEETWGG